MTGRSPISMLDRRRPYSWSAKGRRPKGLTVAARRGFASHGHDVSRRGDKCGGFIPIRGRSPVWFDLRRWSWVVLLCEPAGLDRQPLDGPDLR